jgi:16S rRNA (adenine1518-N6/adenine1519-N6)-dimethyltransferase
MKPLKKFGQNFLQVPAIRTKIVDMLELSADKYCLEIGPGQGALTGLLLEKTHNLICIELDKRCVEFLEAKYSDLRIINQSVLDSKISDMFELPQNHSVSVIGNIPYNITHPILFWLFEQSSIIDRAVLTVQREVAERLVATPRTKNYGITTIATQVYAKCKIGLHIPPGAFFPAPKVQSSVVVLDFYKSMDETKLDKREFLTFIKAAFSQRRKMLSNSLHTYLKMKNIDKATAEHLLGKDTLTKRPEELNINEYITIYNIINRMDTTGHIAR